MSTCLAPQGNEVTHLHLNIQYANSTLFGNIFDGLYTCTIMVPPKLSMLNKATIIY